MRVVAVKEKDRRPNPLPGTCLKDRIILFLGTDEDNYNLTIWETGVKYAERHVKDNDAVSMILRSRSFWFWFKNQWEIIDRSFISLYEVLPESKRMDYWSKAHDPENAVAYPGKEVWEEVWEQCTSETIHNIQKGTYDE